MSTALHPAQWFSGLGQPLREAERSAIAAYLAGLGISSQTPILLVHGWDEVLPIISKPTLSWWNSEEAARRALNGAGNPLSADGAWVELNDSLHAAASIAAARFGCADAGLIKAATGAASYAVHEHQLVLAGGHGGHHAFLHKYALFALGRWPLGLSEDRFAIF